MSPPVFFMGCQPQRMGCQHQGFTAFIPGQVKQCLKGGTGGDDIIQDQKPPSIPPAGMQKRWTDEMTNLPPAFRVVFRLFERHRLFPGMNQIQIPGPQNFRQRIKSPFQDLVRPGCQGCQLSFSQPPDQARMTMKEKPGQCNVLVFLVLKLSSKCFF